MRVPRPRVPAHVTTTRHLGAAYPLVTESGLGHEGVLVGRDLLGGTFVFDPFHLYAQGVVTNPNLVVIGQIGRGKSAFVKSYLWRQAVFGRQAWVVDPKGEYGALAAAWSVRPVALSPGGAVRLNPLEALGGGLSTASPGLYGADRSASWSVGGGEGSGTGDGAAGAGRGDPWEEVPTRAEWRRGIDLLSSLAVACLGRDLLPRERAAVDVALTHAVLRAGQGAEAPVLPQVVDALLDPPEDGARVLRTTRALLMEDGRDIALELRRLVSGDLRGMFDGPTTPGLRLDAPLVVLDLSAVYNSPALGVLMACATAWLQSALLRRPPGHVIVVVDEAWAILSNLGVARWLQTSWKLSRAFGVSNVAVLHRLSDLGTVGAAGSEQVGLAHGLLADSETRVVYAQPHGEVSRAADALGLTETESQLLPQLRRGVALWKVGRRSFLVEHHLSPPEREIIDTDGAMREDGCPRERAGGTDVGAATGGGGATGREAGPCIAGWPDGAGPHHVPVDG